MDAVSATPAEAIIQQIAILNAAAIRLQEAVVCAAKKLSLADRSPDWRDVTELAHLVDCVKRADLVRS